ncbi:MAG: hypothetical protein COA91_10100 [Robiginitomaculum sp.]|nr:MAG: hypothetical protein COA91_10100 [Robiginitomaculum sp.]
MRKSLIEKLLQSTIIAGFAFTGATFTAYAQTADDQPITVTTTDEDDEDEDSADGRDVIVVTGSRLRRTEFTSASPLQVIDGELARDLGLVDAADLLGQTTVVQGQQISTGLSTSAGALTDSGPGSATASLRGLNPGRTLVLVNGRRLAPAGVRGAPSAPDLNLIPGTLVSRVEVLLDGASSVYGSDAVAGVVNYVLRDDFEGIQLDVFATVPSLPGNAGNREVFTATAGVSNDRGFIGLAVEHSRSAGFAEGVLGSFYEPYANGCRSSYAQGASGTVYASRCTGSFGAGAAISPVGFVGFRNGANEPGLPPNFFRIAIAADLIQPDSINGQALLLFPEELEATFRPDFQRTSIFSVGEYDTGLYGDMTAYFEASHAWRETNTNTSGQGAIELPGTYPLNQFGGQTTLFYGNRFVNDTDVAQTRLIGGLRGDLPFLESAGLKNWAFDAYWSYSRSSGQDRVQGIPFLPRLEQTLANTVVDPITGVATCTSRAIAGEGQSVGCRPLDFFEPGFLFGGRFADPADNAYLFPNRLTNTVVKQSLFSGYLSGDLFDIPTGGTAVAGFGGELREDIIETDTSLAGDFLGFFDDPGSNGTRTLREVFGEIELPLIKDRPGVHLLTVNLAGRYTDEDNFGAEATYSVKGQYAPVEWLTLRGTYGTSFRAPNLGEQFGGAVTGFGNPSDPCRTPGITVPFTDFDNDPNTPDTRNYNPALELRDATVLQNCLNGGGPFNLEATDPFSLGIRGLNGSSPVFLGAPTRVASGSNPDLRAETSVAYTFGGTFDQPWTDKFDLQLAVTYFSITVNDEVDTLSAATITNRCYNSIGLTDPLCAFVTRDPRVAGVPESGEISFVSALNLNLGSQVVEGIDYNVEFGFDFKPEFIPFIDAPIDYNLIVRATQSLTQTEEQIQIDGTIIDDDLGEFGNPEWRLNFTNVFSYKDFGFIWQSRYLGSQIEDNADPEDVVDSFFSLCTQAGDSPCLSFDNLADYWIHNASVTYRRDTFVLRVGVNNVFHTPPPLTNNNSLGLLGGIGYDLGGRTLFANVTKKF